MPAVYTLTAHHASQSRACLGWTCPRDLLATSSVPYSCTACVCTASYCCNIPAPCLRPGPKCCQTCSAAAHADTCLCHDQVAPSPCTSLRAPLTLHQPLPMTRSNGSQSAGGASTAAAPSSPVSRSRSHSQVAREALAHHVVGHRGNSRGAPENTLPAIRAAAAQGASAVEVDVQFTKDGVPVLMHDTDTLRTTGIRYTWTPSVPGHHDLNRNAVMMCFAVPQGLHWRHDAAGSEGA